MDELRVFSCLLGNERFLKEELGRLYPGLTPEVEGAGWVKVSLTKAESLRVVGVAFASQVLPAAEEVSATSISTWADLLVKVILQHAGEGDIPWRLHVFCVERPGGPIRAARCRYVETETLGRLKSSWRRIFRQQVTDTTAPFHPREILIQLGLVGPDRGWISVATPERRGRNYPVLSRFSGGEVEVPSDPAPPSRAYRKLLEAEQHLGHLIAPDQTCADLGASPGGWSWVAIQRGARVLAVDRSPLREDLMRHPNLQFIRGDGFRWTPPFRVDWLICDLIAFPEKSLSLLDSWLSRGLCRRFVVTLKFRGEEDYPVVDEAKKILEQRNVRYQVRQLRANKNEVTAMGELAGWEDGSPILAARGV